MLAVDCRTRSETEAEGAAVPEVAHHFLRRRDRRLGRRASAYRVPAQGSGSSSGGFLLLGFR